MILVKFSLGLFGICRYFLIWQLTPIVKDC